MQNDINQQDYSISLDASNIQISLDQSLKNIKQEVDRRLINQTKAQLKNKINFYLSKKQIFNLQYQKQQQEYQQLNQQKYKNKSFLPDIYKTISCSSRNSRSPPKKIQFLNDQQQETLKHNQQIIGQNNYQIQNNKDKKDIGGSILQLKKIINFSQNGPSNLSNIPMCIASCRNSDVNEYLENSQLNSLTQRRKSVINQQQVTQTLSRNQRTLEKSQLISGNYTVDTKNKVNNSFNYNQQDNNFQKQNLHEAQKKVKHLSIQVQFTCDNDTIQFNQKNNQLNISTQNAQFLQSQSPQQQKSVRDAINNYSLSPKNSEISPNKSTIITPRENTSLSPSKKLNSQQQKQLRLGKRNHLYKLCKNKKFFVEFILQNAMKEEMILSNKFNGRQESHFTEEQIMQNENCSQLIEVCMLQYYNIHNAISKKDVVNCIRSLIYIMNQAVKMLDISLLSGLIFFVGSFCLDCQDINKAMFFFKEGKLLNEYTGNNDKMIDFLIALAQCSQQLKEYHAAILFLKKGLQWAWSLNLQNKESQIYHYLGINYFYLGILKTAKTYHEMYINDDHELIDSPVRMMSNNDLYFFNIIQPVCQKQISKALMTQLSLPIYNPFAISEEVNFLSPVEKTDNKLDQNQLVIEFQQSSRLDKSSNNHSITSLSSLDKKFQNSDKIEQTQLQANQNNNINNQLLIMTCDNDKKVNYQNCEAQLILEELMREPQFQFQPNTPKYSQNNAEGCQRKNIFKNIIDKKINVIKNVPDLPPSIIAKIQIKKQNEVNKKIKQQILLSDTLKYKVDFNTLLDQRLKQKVDLQETMDRINHKVLYSCKINLNHQRVNINNLNQEKTLKEQSYFDTTRLLKKYNLMLSKILYQFFQSKIN